ncbi:hypothetical protein RvY_17046-1 [Ramazzottius varieornatus]|uniref:Uncharacterized protein n=1 Tax=Ramazzottius varieornatus TaxID=947166 RepID=A0A1D1W0Q1_RAMVA|nr:hypothetical protein RvY_17046-1 [Ramazzottius varieornatus]
MSATAQGSQAVHTVVSKGMTETVFPDGTVVTVLPDGAIETQQVTITSQDYTAALSDEDLPVRESEMTTVHHQSWPADDLPILRPAIQGPSPLSPSLPTYAETGPPSYAEAATMPSPADNRSLTSTRHLGPSAPPPEPLNFSLLPPAVTRNE